VKSEKLNTSRVVRIALCFSLLISHFSLSSAQTRAIDSIRTVLKTEQEDTGRVFTLNALCEVYWRSSRYDSAFANAMQAKALAEKLETSTDPVIAKAGKNGLAGAYRVMGIVYRHHGNYPKALENELKALDLCQQTGNTNGIASNMGNIGIVYWNMNNYDKAL
jgi:tetratricopeptide (TPR) repeat protein